MVVLSLVDCPAALRGDLTKWMLEISAGVFIGRISARVRDMLWERVEKYSRGGRGIMVYNANNEQGFNFKVLRSDWELVDFEGMKLMLRPSPARVGELAGRRGVGSSKAAHRRMAKRMAARKLIHASADALMDTSYVVLDMEMTGVSLEKSEIFRIAAIRIDKETMRGDFTALIRTSAPLPPMLELTSGVTNEILTEQGEDFHDIWPRLCEFMGDRPVITHNGRFFLSFLHAACRKHGCAAPANEMHDTLALARAQGVRPGQDTLENLSEHFSLDITCPEPRLQRCVLTWHLYEKLIKLQSYQNPTT